VKDYSEITSKTFSISELFNDNYFFIPDYQRGYSWEEEQLKDLIKDIDNISKLDHSHYTGTIVAARTESSLNRFELVDGQQRLTTIIILLVQIYHFDSVKYSEIERLYINRGEIGKEVVVFEPNSETKTCFKECIIYQRTFNSTIKSHEAIIFAQSFFKNWLNANKDRIEEIYQTVTNKLNFLFYTPKKNKEIGIMFEVINNRGKKLSELEKIKNYFIYYSTIHDTEALRADINEKWAVIQMNLSQAGKTSNDEENTFLRNSYIVFFQSNKERSWAVYEECKIIFDVKNLDRNYVFKAVSTMRKFVTFLADASLSYAWFYNQQYFRSTCKNFLQNQLETCLKHLRCQPVNASIMPVYLAVMSKNDKPEKVIKLLTLIEKVNMRLYVFPGILQRADSKQGDLFFYANIFYNSNWTSDEGDSYTKYKNVKIIGDIFDWLFAQLTQFTYEFCHFDRVIDSLTLNNNDKFDFYRWAGLRYFLACYEETIKSQRAKRTFDIQRILSGKKAVGKNFNDQLSIEHIWASKNRQEDFPPGFYTKRRLGNFVLCGLSSNISLGNEDIFKKIESLIEQGNVGEGALDMLQISELNKIYNLSKEKIDKLHKRQSKSYWKDIGNSICDLREATFIDFAFKRWGLDGEKRILELNYKSN
jgi:uncharacterized protein with ParB-like and HNH nuclease domain